MNGLMYDNQLVNMGGCYVPIDELQRQQLIKESKYQFDLCYDDYLPKPKKKKSSKAKRSMSKKPGARCKSP